MSKVRDPFEEIKLFESFTQFVEAEAIAFFEGSKVIKDAFFLMSNPGLNVIIKMTGYGFESYIVPEAFGDQFLTGMEIVRQHDALHWLEEEARILSSAKGWEKQIAGRLIINAVRGDKPAFVRLVQDIYDTSKKQLDDEVIFDCIRNLSRPLRRRRSQMRASEWVIRLKSGANQLGLDLDEIQHWWETQRKLLSRAGANFFRYMSKEILARETKVASNDSSAQDGQDLETSNLPQLKIHDRHMYQLSLIPGMTQTSVAKMINEEFGTNYTQPRVAEAIKRMKAHWEASGLNEIAPQAKLPASKTLIVDPHKLELGRRQDGRAPHIVEKIRQVAKDQAENE